MAYNNYIVALQGLRGISIIELIMRFEISLQQFHCFRQWVVHECMLGRGDSKRLKESLEYVIEISNALKGIYKNDEIGE